MVSFGAIRWDGYYDATVPPNNAVAWTAETLSPQRFRYRTPIHAREVNPQRIVWDISQATIDNEITAAVAGGLDYWIFLRYGGVNQPQNEGLNAGWNLFQTSSIKNSMKWISMQQLGTLGSWTTVPNFDTEVAQTVSWMQQPNYKKVLGNRPLLYIMYTDQTFIGYWNGDFVRLKTMVDKIRTDAQAAGLGNPYIATFYLGFPAGSEYARAGMGADAITDYAAFPHGGKGPYSTVATDAQNYWPLMAAVTPKIIPICMMGWPPAPIYERPSVWFKPGSEGDKFRPYFLRAQVFEDATMPELTAHFDAAEAYVNANPAICETGCVTIYAWNEATEGGWLLPTHVVGHERLDALYTALHN